VRAVLSHPAFAKPPAPPPTDRHREQGATLAPRPDGVGGRVGDLLVTYPSASGAGRRRRIPFDVENGRHVGGIDHMRLLNHPAVYDQLRNWLGRDPPERSP